MDIKGYVSCTEFCDPTTKAKVSGAKRLEHFVAKTPGAKE